MAEGVIKAVIVDDSKKSIDLLSGIIKDYTPEIYILGSATDFKSALSLINEKKPELVFLDIEIKDKTGFDLLKVTSHKDFEVIFFTGYNQYAIDAFKHNAIHYLVKPISPQDIIEAIRRYKKQKANNRPNTQRIINAINAIKNQEDRKIALPTESELKFVRVKDIKYVQADGSYSIIFLKSDEKIIVSKLLKELEKKLPEDEFYRVSKSYLINLSAVNRVKHIDGGIIEMCDGKNISIPRRRRHEFTIQMMKYIEVV